MKVENLFLPTKYLPFPNLCEISVIEKIVWDSRPDLQSAFSLKDLDSQKSFRGWASVSLLREYGINPDNISSTEPRVSSHSSLEAFLSLILRRNRRVKAIMKRFVIVIDKYLSRLTLEIKLQKFKRKSGEVIQVKATKNCGVNLLGYVYQELGMGEHVRNSALSLDSSGFPYYLLNFDGGSVSKKRSSFELPLHKGSERYPINLIHANADQMLELIRERGLGFFDDTYNIGFWAWELEKAPEVWRSVIELVDEIWAPSKFVADSFECITEKPIRVMPLAVEFTASDFFDRNKYGIPANAFTFLYFFDFFSYMQRKNAMAALNAFVSSFSGDLRSYLVIKVMNGSDSNPLFRQLLSEAQVYQNVILINDVMNQEDLYALLNDCGAFISLHRSEGFGRGPAEALYLGKPVIVTSYSGNMDFTNEENSYLVDYRLVPVCEGEYPFSEGQFWAEPDWRHAASLMRVVFENQSEASKKGEVGARLMQHKFSRKAVSEAYQKRFEEICDLLK